jgi:hypothetical protein
MDAGMMQGVELPLENGPVTNRQRRLQSPVKSPCAASDENCRGDVGHEEVSRGEAVGPAAYGFRSTVAGNG